MSSPAFLNVTGVLSSSLQCSSPRGFSSTSSSRPLRTARTPVRISRHVAHPPHLPVCSMPDALPTQYGSASLFPASVDSADRAHFTDEDSVEATSEASHYLEDASIDSSGRSGGDSFSGGGGSGGGGGGGSGDGGGAQDGGSLPEDVSKALAAGVLTTEALARYKSYAFGANPLMRLLISIPAFRTRVLADSAFLFKLLVQEVIGNGTAVAGEIAVRGKDIVNELEYVASDLIVGTVIEAAFVWLLAPRLSSATAAAGGGAGKSGLSAFLASLPANAFEASSPLRQYTLPLRCASFVYAALQYAAIGMAAGVVGTAITYGLLEGRKLIDKDYKPDRPMPPILASSAGWAAFMALSSNTRFQLVEGIERVMPRLFPGGQLGSSALNSSIVALRFLNNYWGGVQFVQFFRFLGLHAVAE